MKKGVLIVIILAVAVFGVYLILSRNGGEVISPTPPEELSLNKYRERYPNFGIKVEGGVIYATNLLNDTKAIIIDSKGLLDDGWAITIYDGESRAILSPGRTMIVFTAEKIFTKSGSQFETGSRVYSYNLNTKSANLLLESERSVERFWFPGEWNNEGISISVIGMNSGYLLGEFVVSATGRIIIPFSERKIPEVEGRYHN